VLTQRRIVLVLGLYFFTFLYMSNMQVALALLTNQRLAWTQTEIGHVFGLFGLIMLVVQGLLIGRLTARFGSHRLVLAGSLVSMAGLATIALSYHPLPLVGGLALLGVGLGVVNPSLSSLASEAAGSARQGTVLGFAQSAGTLARIVGPVLGGVLFARVAGGAPFVGGAIAAVIAAGLALSLQGPREPAAAAG
jgi:DHA1 family tetracycline resistance protein-like MFS transporter